jgi:hypothetical protein
MIPCNYVVNRIIAVMWPSGDGELLSIVVDAGGLERGGVLWVNENYHLPFPKEYDSHARVYR